MIFVYYCMNKPPEMVYDDMGEDLLGMVSSCISGWSAMGYDTTNASYMILPYHV